MRARLWVPLLQKVRGAEMGGRWVGGMQWVAVCHEWSGAFASMCKAAWEEDFLRGLEQLRPFRHQRTMGIKHITVGWSRTLWTYMWIDHMYAYVAKWGTLARFSYGSRGCRGTAGG